jgi:ABC-type lipoprotein release transport system permease subunit
MYPVVQMLAVGIGIGLSIFTMLQNGLNAAIMRVLGSSELKTRFVFLTEQAIVCTAGLVVGLFVLAITGMPLPEAVGFAQLYLIGYVFGGLTGAIIVTRKSPLELLQVRE